MRYIKNNQSSTFIKDSDITLSESFGNQKLSDVLTSYKNELDLLKSNVKWLAKYGGVGGSGSGSGTSSGSTNLSYTLTINYTDINNTQKDTTIRAGLTSSILVKPGTLAYVTIKLTKFASTCDYFMNYSYGTINGQAQLRTPSNIQKAFTIRCSGNLNLEVSAFSNSEDIKTTTITINTLACSADLYVSYDGIKLLPGTAIISDYISNSVLKGNLTNYLPNLYEGHIVSVRAGDTELPFDVQESTGLSQEKIYTFEIPAQTVFNQFGPYQLVMEYEYNGETLDVPITYIYKDSGVFVFCQGVGNTVYSSLQTEPKTTNSALELVKFVVYPGLDAKNLYTVTYTITYEGKDYTINATNGCNSQQYYELRFDNIYEESDFTSENLYKLVTIQFNIGNDEFLYYIYVKLKEQFLYIFKDSDGKYFYNAKHICTTDANTQKYFPFESGLFSKLKTNIIYKIPQLTDITGMNSDIEYVYNTENKGYVTNGVSNAGGDLQDVLISFGLKYLESNRDLAILEVYVTDSYKITIYPDKISYGNNNYDRWCIPNDNLYHLILIYYKPVYTIDIDSMFTELDCHYPTGTSCFICCVDGVIETVPLKLEATSNISFTSDSYIKYKNGNWDFDFIGIASLNAKCPLLMLSNMTESMRQKKNILRYILDFDPIIPANYNQAYIKSKSATSTLTNQFDSSIYRDLYDNTYSYGINYYKNINKFIKVSPQVICKLSELPIYIIELESKDHLLEDGLYINSFLYNTFGKKYQESEKPEPIMCSLYKADVNGEKLSEFKLVNDEKYLFSINYLGSSTLLYGVKNFTIKAEEYEDPSDERKHTILWTPDINKFKPEKEFILKADMVDSSHSNNVIIGKFVNNYMQNSALNTNCKTCLEGFPILLFMRDTTVNDPASTNNYVFLGIYSFNLGRSSEFNLGYKSIKLPDEEGGESTEIGQSVINITNTDYEGPHRAYYLNSLESEKVTYVGSYKVAEVLGNSEILFDYSLYDPTMLKTSMLGDFYSCETTSTGTLESTNFHISYTKAFKSLNRVIANFLIGNLVDYIEYSFQNKSELWGYYSPKDQTKFFNVLLLNFLYSGAIPYSNIYYYTNDSGTITHIPENAFILTLDDLDSIKPYKNKGTNNVTIVNNPYYQFHKICDDKGNPLSYNYYYVEMITKQEPDPLDDYFNYDNALRYYIVCMLFAMNDSVQKNLTIRCKNWNTDLPNEWLLGFYDMDTSFGLNNSGGSVNFRAFSDYISENGEIITDFYPLKTLSESDSLSGSGFDVPSSFLFLFAKYLNIVSGENTSGIRTDRTDPNTLILKTPFNYWQKLRQTDSGNDAGLLSNIDSFFATYVDNHFATVNPLIWNLNFMYKYFSLSGAGTEGLTDTEQSRFHGTRRHSRKLWLKNRLEILDVLFGIRNNHTIGCSNSNYICKQKLSLDATELSKFSGYISNVPISLTMFPNFTKGFEGTIDVAVTAQALKPICFLPETGRNLIYISNNEGRYDTIKQTISTSTAVGFYGTTTLKTVSNCGQFFNKGENTIDNKIIETINILTSYSGTNISLLTTPSTDPCVQAVKYINIGLPAFKYSWGTISITANNGDKTIEKINITNANISNLQIACLSGTLTINELVLDGVNCESLEIDLVTINKLTITNCNIKNYTLNRLKCDKVNIDDPSTLTFSINSIYDNGTDVVIKMSNIQTIHIEGFIKSFDNLSSSSNCNSISVDNCGCETTTLRLKNMPNYSGNININLNPNVKLLNLDCYNNQNCTNYNIYGDNVLKVIFLGLTFRNNTKLENIKLNNGYLADQLNGNLIIDGNYTFMKCSKLDLKSIIGESGEIPLMLSRSADHQKIFKLCTQIKTLDFINICLYLAGDEADYWDLSEMFAGCYDIVFNTSSDSSTYSNVVTAIRNAIRNADDITTKASNMLIGTLFLFFDKDLIHPFIYKDNEKYILPNIASGLETDNYLYITEDFLYNEKNEPYTIHQLSIGKKFWDNDTNTDYQLSPIKIIAKNGLSYSIKDSVNLIDFLGGNDSTLEIIDGLHFYSGKQDTTTINCQYGGFPKTLTKLSEFCSNNIEKFIFKDFTEVFDKVKSTCLVFLDKFFGNQTVNNLSLSEQISMFYLFWENVDNTAVAKVSLKLDHKTTDDTIANRYSDGIRRTFNIQKKLTSQEFRLIMQYLRSQQDIYLSGNTPECDLYDQIPGLFQNCTIFNVDTFLNLIKNGDGTFFDKITSNDGDYFVNFKDLNMTFKKCKLQNNSGEEIPFDVSLMWSNSTNKPSIYTLRETFEGTYLKRIIDTFNILDVLDMQKCFYNCRFKIENWTGVINNSNPHNSLPLEISWGWYDDFLLIPGKFFNFCKNANINECFASSTIKADNITGQLPRDSNELWWDNGKVSSFTDLFKYALLHPKKTGSNYALYSEVYTDTFKGFKSMYKHVTMPYLKTDELDNTKLYIFEKVSEVNLEGGLPRLPNKSSSFNSFYNVMLEGHNYSVQISSDNKLPNKGNNAKSSIPYSLFLILYDLDFKVDTTNSKPILLNDTYSYSEDYFNNLILGKINTPGGINVSTKNYNSYLI